LCKRGGNWRKKRVKRRRKEKLKEMGAGSGAKGEGCGRKGAAKWEKMSHKVKSKGLPVRQLVK